MSDPCVLDVGADLTSVCFRKGSLVQVVKESGMLSCIKFDHNDGYGTGWVETSFLIPLQVTYVPDIPNHLMVCVNWPVVD